VGSLRLQYAKRGRFERRLIEEWQPRFAQMCDGLSAASKDAALRSAGQQLYGWVENDARFPIRTQTVRFLTVGSYHIVAEDLRVGWHRDFETLHADEPAEPADA
jgi:hypothetical protein